MLQYLAMLGGIILVDLTLSGDNALVIGAAASGLPRQQRRLAILTGGGAAIVLRIIFTIAAALLLQIPLTPDARCRAAALHRGAAAGGTTWLGA